MDVAELRRRCLAQPAATEGRPFGADVLVVKVGGRIFAIIAEDDDPPTVSLKCDPELALLLRQSYASVRPGYHLNKRHWNTVRLDGTVPDDEVLAWVEDSYDLVVAGLPRRVRDTLDL